MSEDTTTAADARSDQAGWLSLDDFMANAYRHWRGQPVTGRAVFERALRAHFEGAHKLGLALGGKMEFQDLDPDVNPGMSARFRLTMPDGERVALDGHGGLLNWMVERRPQLRALALRHHLAGRTPSPIESRDRPRRRAL
jgi:hypothetical protein